VNLAVVGSFVFFILCLVADFHEISNRFFKFLWDGSDIKHNKHRTPRNHTNCSENLCLKHFFGHKL